jgi:hypothetical protein
MSDLNRAGRVYVSLEGQRIDVKAEGIEYGFGLAKLSEIVGADGLHGFAGEPQAPFISFTVTDHKKLDVEDLLKAQDVTVTAELFNGKVLVLSQASNTAEPQGKSSDGGIPLRFVGTSLKELPAS